MKKNTNFIKYYDDIFCPSNIANKKTWVGTKTLIYDPLIRSNVLILNNNSKLTSDKVSITKRYLVLQICLYPTNSFSLTLDAKDRDGFNKRIIFINSSTSNKKNEISNLIRFSNISSCHWVNLNIDIFSFFKIVHKNSHIVEIDKLEISGNLKLRKILATSAVPDSFEYSSIKELKYNNNYRALSHIFNSDNYLNNIKDEYYLIEEVTDKGIKKSKVLLTENENRMVFDENELLENKNKNIFNHDINADNTYINSNPIKSNLITEFFNENERIKALNNYNIISSNTRSNNSTLNDKNYDKNDYYLYNSFLNNYENQLENNNTSSIKSKSESKKLHKKRDIHNKDIKVYSTNKNWDELSINDNKIVFSEDKKIVNRITKNNKKSNMNNLRLISDGNLTSHYINNEIIYGRLTVCENNKKDINLRNTLTQDSKRKKYFLYKDNTVKINNTKNYLNKNFIKEKYKLSSIIDKKLHDEEKLSRYYSLITLHKNDNKGNINDIKNLNNDNKSASKLKDSLNLKLFKNIYFSNLKVISDNSYFTPPYLD